MPTLDVTQTFTNGQANDGADVKGAFNTVETWANTTKLDDDNLQYTYQDVNYSIRMDVVSDGTSEYFHFKPKVDRSVMTPVRMTVYFRTGTGTVEIDLETEDGGAWSSIATAETAVAADTLVNSDNFSGTIANDQLCRLKLTGGGGDSSHDVSATLQCKVKVRA